MNYNYNQQQQQQQHHRYHQRAPPPQQGQHHQNQSQNPHPQPRPRTAGNPSQSHYNEYGNGNANIRDNQYNSHEHNYSGNHYDYEQSYDRPYDQRNWHGDIQRQDRQYHYDDRYRMNAQREPSQPAGFTRSHEYRQDHGAHPLQTGDIAYQGQSVSRPQERERILNTEPQSPKSIPWDNPFGDFPKKKQQNKSQDAKTWKDRSPATSLESQLLPDGRPVTSHSGQRQDIPGQSGPNNGTQPSMPGYDEHNLAHAAPRRKEVPRSNPQIDDRSSHTQRLAPRRAMTGPILSSQYQFSEPNQQDSSHGDYRGIMRQQTYDEYPQSHGPSESAYTMQQPQLRYSDNQNYSRTDFANYANEPLNQNVAHRAGSIQSDSAFHGRRTSSTNASFDAPKEKPIRDVPNFDAMATNTNEDQLALTQPPRPVQPYRKPTYQNQESLQALSGGSTSVGTTQEELISPLADFSFDLPPSASPNTSSAAPYSNPGPGDYPNSPTYTTDSQGRKNGTISYPPRAASRNNVRPTLTPQYQQPPVIPLQYVQQQGPFDNNSSNFGEDGYEQGHGDHFPVNQSRYEPAQPRDASRSGYDPRLQSTVNGTPVPAQNSQNYLNRPMTSNSTHSLPQGPNRRASSESYQGSFRSQADFGARPVPIRPGLMQPPPQPAAQSPSQRNSNQPPNTAQSDRSRPQSKLSPVTTQELNNLRQTYESDPNNHAFGLRFAKRLAEAAKTLPNESGRADPKQVAKSRERYVLDAHRLVKKLIQAGYTEAMFYMADCYGQGSLGLQPDPKEAFSLYQSAAKLGHPQSAYRVAVCCELGPEEGGGTRRDPLKAVQWYKRAASLGDTPAMYKMGMIQLKGLLSQPRNAREAISWLKRAAERANEENPHALHELGLLYESAKPTDVILKDEQYALQLFRQSAELGYKYSQFRLGSAYEYGLLGCPIDPRSSIAWYSRAAAQGEHQSEFALSGWYLTGGGQPPPGQQPLLEQSDTEAYLWARKAAASGLAKAEYAMGYYTEVGIGVSPNIDEAKKWYFRAAAQDHPKARERLEDLKRGGARMQKTRVSRSNVGKHNEGECAVM